MIRRIGQALVFVLAVLIIGAEVQRAEDAELAEHLARSCSDNHHLETTMTYEEKRKQYGSDEAMARAMFDIAVALQLDVSSMEHVLAIAQHKLNKAELKLFRLENANLIKKTKYILEPQ